MRERLLDKAGRKSIINLIDERFGRLVVRELITDEKFLEELKISKKGSVWRCHCDCGADPIVAGRSLAKGNTRSCGCLAKEVRSEMGKLRAGYNRKTDTPFRKLYQSYIYWAKKRHLSFDLSEELFRKLTQSDCAYCGEIPKNKMETSRGHEPYIYNGVDRVNSFLGYSDNNCVSCCKFCNMAKSKMNDFEFAKWVCKVADFWAKERICNG